MKIIEDKEYWVIGANKWCKVQFNKKQAVRLAKTLQNCINCVDCYNCKECVNCRNCSYCSYCRNCSECSECYMCGECLVVRYSSSCYDCDDCAYCRFCENCSNCNYCDGCVEFTINPQRIYSPIMGSRESQTVFYWTHDKELVVSGCFKGTIKDFEEKVIKKHRDNQYGQDYLKWIEAIKIYQKTMT
jgi:hypothetical protein